MATPKSAKVPKYCKHARGSAFVKWKGKTHYLGKYGTDESRKRYRRFLEQIELKAEYDAIDAGNAETRAVVRLIALYLEHCATYYVDTTGRVNGEYKAMEIALAEVDVVMGDEHCGRIGPSHFTQLQRHLLAKGNCRTYINKSVSRTKRMFKWACANGLCPAPVYYGLACVEPLRRGRTKARESKKVRPVSREVFEATLPWLSPVVADMARVQFLCGMRPSELCRMRPCDVDTGGDIWIYKPETHKTDWRGHHRAVAIPRAAQRILKPYLQRDPTAWLFSPREAEKIRNDAKQAAAGTDRKTKRFPSEARRLAREKLKRRGTAFTRLRHRYDANSYRRAIDYGLKKAKRAGTTIESWFPYQLRHGIATEVAQALGQVAAQRWLGHEHLDTTSIYVEKQVSDLLDTARQLDRIWEAAEAARSTPQTLPIRQSHA